MLLVEELRGGLPEMHYLRLFADPNLLVLDSSQVDRILICQIVEQIQVFLCNFPFLLEAKYQIYPLLQMSTH